MPAATVLLTLMGLDIGGAETHVVTLAKALKDQGYHVVLASSGGVYEEEIRAYGIKHYRVNLTSKQPLAVVCSMVKLSHIIKQEKVDLIHAHARIPAFLCNIIARFHRVPFMTTAHIDFRSNLLLRHLSVWGEKTIAVSTDIKDHLIKTFHVNADQIVVINNGIDTSHFYPGLDYGDLSAELRIDDSCSKIVCVTRLDYQLADVVLNLIEAVSALSGKFNRLSLVIAGSGNRIGEVEALAQEVNASLGREVVRILGKRTDINHLLNFSTVFIGISRAAMEAMACEKPVILAGWWSFVGLMAPDKMERLKQDNFTGRSFNQPVTPELLAGEIATVLAWDEPSRSEYGRQGRKLVLQEYSSLAMAQQTAEVYEMILQKGVDG